MILHFCFSRGLGETARKNSDEDQVNYTLQNPRSPNPDHKFQVQFDLVLLKNKNAKSTSPVLLAENNPTQVQFHPDLVYTAKYLGNRSEDFSR